MQHFKYGINTTIATSATRVPEVKTTACPGESCLGNSMEHSCSSTHNASNETEESSVGKGVSRSFGTEPVTKDSGGGTSSNKESSNSDARSVEM